VLNHEAKDPGFKAADFKYKQLVGWLGVRGRHGALGTARSFPTCAPLPESVFKPVFQPLNLTPRCPPTPILQGAMATVGGTNAIMELGSGPRRLDLAGFVSWVAWRSAYLTRLGSLRNRCAARGRGRSGSAGCTWLRRSLSHGSRASASLPTTYAHVLATPPPQTPRMMVAFDWTVTMLLVG
jgi:hypothetical protein